MEPEGEGQRATQQREEERQLGKAGDWKRCLLINHDLNWLHGSWLGTGMNHPQGWHKEKMTL